MKRFLVALLVVEYLYIFGILLNYDNAWMHPEMIGMHDWLLKNGTALQKEDVARVFNALTVEQGHPRLSRPLSNILNLVNAKFRGWLWHFIPPHPSFSLSWFLSFLLVPLLLFRFFRNMGYHETIALGGVGLYLASVGFLGPLIMLFHSGKSMVNIFSVMTLFLASSLYAKMQREKPLKKSGKVRRLVGSYFVLYIVAFLTFFWDETGLFLFVMLFVLFAPTLFFSVRSKLRYWLLGGYFLLPVVYYIMVAHILPSIGRQFGYGNLDVSELYIMPSIKDLFWPDWSHVFTNILLQFNDHLNLHLHIFDLYPTPLLQGFAVLYHLSIVGIACMILVGCRRTQWAKWSTRLWQEPLYLVVSSGGLLFAYSYFQTFQLSQYVKVWGTWWYGNLYSLIFVIFVTALLMWLSQKFRSTRYHLAIVGFMSILLINFLLVTTYRNNIFKIENLTNRITSEEVWTNINQYEYYSFRESYRCHLIKWSYTLHRWRSQRFYRDVEKHVKESPCYFLNNHIAYLEIELLPEFQNLQGRLINKQKIKQTQYADVNGDSKTDILYFDIFDTNAVFVSLSNETGFTQPVTWITYPDSLAEQLRYADIDGDVKADALYFDTLRGNGELWVSLSTGSNFTRPVNWLGHRQKSLPEQMQYADVNGDNRVDALYFDTLGVLWATPSANTKRFFVQIASDNSMSGRIQYPDVNGDGKADALYFDTFRTSSVWVSLSTGIGFTEPQQWLQYERSVPEQLQYADVNGDDKMDALYFDTSCTNAVLVSLSTGTSFTSPAQWAQYGDSTPEQLQYADVNGDGRADAIYWDMSGKKEITASLSTGTGFTALQPWGQYDALLPEQIQYVDINGDGKADALYFDAFGNNSVWGSLSTGVEFTAPVELVQLAPLPISK